MTDEELEFHYFHLHDFDKNKHLDGLEILQAIKHTIHEDELGENDLEVEKDDMAYYIALIDKLLEEDDTNRDGLLSYTEYVLGRKREVDKEKIHQGNDVEEA